MIELDLFFTKISGITKGFAIMVAILIGAIVSFFLQIPILIRKKKKLKWMMIHLKPKQVLVALDLTHMIKQFQFVKILIPKNLG